MPGLGTGLRTRGTNAPWSRKFRFRVPLTIKLTNSSHHKLLPLLPRLRIQRNNLAVQDIMKSCVDLDHFLLGVLQLSLEILDNSDQVTLCWAFLTKAGSWSFKSSARSRVVE